MLLLLWTACAAPTPTGPFSHVLWTETLAAYVDAKGRVDYKGLQEHREGIDAYVALVAASSPALHPERFPTRNEKLAYYLNAYNAYAIQGVIDRPGLKGVNQSRWMMFSFFYLTQVTVGQKWMSLHGLENDVIRSQFPDPYVHFALNCNSVGCPRLPQEAFVPERLPEQLEAAALEFCQDPGKVQVEGTLLKVSQIFEWYGSDFDTAGGVVAFIRNYRPDLPADLSLSYIPYDWTLIAQEGREP
ncbi:MAG TPA: DUF547 domain-containing protein [Myxococcota bacterium]|nr:DUF547 domain-containing protein [Myxococcota bacterium]